MEGEQKTYELRSRSRSRSETPQILSRIETENDGSEHHYDLRSRSRDRSMTPGEVSSSRRSSSRSLPSSVIKARNKNMDTITEQKDDTLTDITVEKHKSSVRSETTVKGTKKAERRSERQRTKRQIFANGQSESKDDSSDTKSETKERKSLTPRRMMTSDYSSEEGDREDRPSSAYEFYKQQGEYWNKFPKTDYTYSQSSTCRYEVAPGIKAIPNMSRRSLHSDSLLSSQTSNSQDFSQSSKDSQYENNTTMEFDTVHRNATDTVSQLIPHIRKYDAAGQSAHYKRTVETHSVRREYVYNSANENDLNERYESWANKLNSKTRYRSASNVDSDTDFDDVIAVSNYKLRNTRKLKLTSLVSTWFYTALHIITFGLFKKQESSSSHYYRRHYEETKWSRFQRQINTVMQHIYLLLVKVILLDSWLLSKASKIRERVQGRRAKILWLLLPLILTIGCLFLPHISSAIPLTYYKQMLFESRKDTPIVQSYTQGDLMSKQEVKNLVDLLVSQHLQSVKAEQSTHLVNVTQVIEDLKRTQSDIQKQYDEKLSSLEQELELEKSNREQCRAEELNVVRVEFLALKNLYTQLKACCDAASPATVSEDEIRKQVDKVVHEIVKVQQEELRKTKVVEASNSISSPSGSSLGIDEIRNIVLGILKIYDADKTGRVDWALESAGGEIISTRCTQHFNMHSRAFKIFGLTLYHESNNPRTVIQGNILRPGVCWAFQDFPGYLLIRLRSPIRVTGFTIEHAPRANLPNGEMKSAPRKFNVWGLRREDDFEPVMFGEYEFLDSDDSLQYFPVQNTSITQFYEYIELRIHSNHGQLEYTCLYRFRVHGDLA